MVELLETLGKREEEDLHIVTLDTGVQVEIRYAKRIALVELVDSLIEKNQRMANRLRKMRLIIFNQTAISTPDADSLLLSLKDVCLVMIKDALTMLDTLLEIEASVLVNG